MRYIAAIALIFVAAQTASAVGEPPNAAGSQPPSNFSVDRPAAATTEELKKKVEQGGFKDVEVVPRMFVVLAKKPDGQGVSLIVDADTMQALQLGADDADQSGDQSAQGGACKGPSGE
jgi:hypothetical protein